MTFNEANTVEEYLRYLLSGTQTTASSPRAKDVGGTYTGSSQKKSGLGWQYFSAQQLPRRSQEVFEEDEDRGKAALTELFLSEVEKTRGFARNAKTLTIHSFGDLRSGEGRFWCGSEGENLTLFRRSAKMDCGSGFQGGFQHPECRDPQNPSPGLKLDMCDRY